MLMTVEPPDWRSVGPDDHAGPVPALDSCVHLREK